MDDYEKQIIDEDKLKTGSNIKSSSCCADYCSKLRTKPFQKKPISIDINECLQTRLKRCLGTADLTAYGVASMIGGTIFVLTGAVARTKAGPSTFVAYILAGFVALLNCLNYSELACRFPKAGSTYTYAYVMLGEFPAFLAGWSIILEYILGVSSVARGWSSNLNSITGGRILEWTKETFGQFGTENGFLAEYLDFVAVALIIVVCITTCFGIEKSSWLNLGFTIVNVLVLFTVTVYMLVYSKTEYLTITPPENSTYSPVNTNLMSNAFLPFGVAGLIKGTATCFNAFIGFDMISTCAEETRDPAKSIPRSNIISVILVTVLISLAALSLTMYVPWYTFDMGAPFLMALLSNDVNGGSYTVRNVLFYFVGCGCLIGLFSNILTSAIAAPRIAYSMGQDGLIFNAISTITEPFKTPMLATTLIAIIASALALIFGIDSLADFLSLGTLIAYSMTAFGVVLVRYCKPPETIHSAFIPEKQTIEAEKPVTKENIEVDLPTEAAACIGQPGYLKKWWANHLCNSLVRLLTINQRPGHVVTVSMLFFVGSIIGLLCTVLILPINMSIGWVIWQYVGATLWLFLGTLSIILISMHQQFLAPRPNLYRLPMVPLLPCCTIFVNSVLISELSWMTWARFVIWVIIGCLIYLTYGVFNSNPSYSDENDPILRKKSIVKYA